MPATARVFRTKPMLIALHPGRRGILRLVRDLSGSYVVTLAALAETRVLAEADSLILAEALFAREVARHG